MSPVSTCKTDWLFVLFLSLSRGTHLWSWNRTFQCSHSCQEEEAKELNVILGWHLWQLFLLLLTFWDFSASSRKVLLAFTGFTCTNSKAHVLSNSHVLQSEEIPASLRRSFHSPQWFHPISNYMNKSSSLRVKLRYVHRSVPFAGVDSIQVIA